jgi:hypothetical protein
MLNLIANYLDVIVVVVVLGLVGSTWGVRRQ